MRSRRSGEQSAPLSASAVTWEYNDRRSDHSACRQGSLGDHVGIRSIVPFGQFGMPRASFILILDVGSVTRDMLL